jgi:NTP pyrophosphatase (non-canonical NTP hydrolase)
MTIDRNEIYALALTTWGEQAQLGLLQEECAELIAAVSRFHRGRCDGREVANEVADVLIMCEQMKLIVGSELVDEAIRRKLVRLKQRLRDSHEVLP